MKRFYFGAVLAFAASLCACPAWPGEPVHVLITAGQSNTDGRVSNMELPPYIKALATDTSTFAKGEYTYCKIAQNRTDGRFVPFWPQCERKPVTNKWAYDAVTYYWLEQLWQTDFYVIKWVVGGTAIAPGDSSDGRYWSSDSAWLARNTSTVEGGKSLLLSLVQNIDSCIDLSLSRLPEGYRIDAFLWHQGESDQGRGSSYYENLKGVLAYVRRHLTQKTGQDYSRLPFIFGTVSRQNRSFDSEVEAAMHRLAAEDPDVYLVDMSEGELQRDRLHFTAVSAAKLGGEMYRQVRGLLR